MASTARIDELKKKFDENPRRYFAPLANEFRKAGDIEQAIVICEEFLPQQPGHMSGHIVYGQALFEAAKMADARTVFETALGLDPENLIALRHLGDIARGQSDFDAARNWYVRVLDADPRNEEIQNLIASIDAELTVAAPPAAMEPAPVAPLAAPPELHAEEAATAFHLDLQGTSPFGAPASPPPVPAATADQTPTAPMPTVSRPVTLHDEFSLHGIESTPDTASLMPDQHDRAEGLEPAEFTTPVEHIAESADLDASLQSGVPSFEPPNHQVTALDGLQGSGGIAHDELRDAHGETRVSSAFPQLDIEGGLLMPSAQDMATPIVAAQAIPPAVPVESAMPDMEFDLPEELPGGLPNELPEGSFELPPEVIAAEAELIDAGETPAPPAPTEEEQAEYAEPEQPLGAQAPFVTETMAELYVSQGFREQAFLVYSQLLHADPGNTRLQQRVAELTPEPGVEAATKAEVHDDGPNVRDFFARFAARRPAHRPESATPPAADDFMMEASPAVASELEADDRAPDTAPMAPAIERAAAMRTPPGSIDALFGNRQPGTSEDSAAAALAQAFGGGAQDAPEIVGHPARAASGELSLDSVFRDGPARPPRPSQSFSFDQFFSEGAAAGNVPRSSGSQQTQRASEDAARSDAPAERSADDIEQFNSWLQGLKQR